MSEVEKVVDKLRSAHTRASVYFDGLDPNGDEMDGPSRAWFAVLLDYLNEALANLDTKADGGEG